MREIYEQAKKAFEDIKTQEMEAIVSIIKLEKMIKSLGGFREIPSTDMQRRQQIENLKEIKRELSLEIERTVDKETILSDLRTSIVKLIKKFIEES